MEGKISIENLQLFGHHGVREDERASGQLFAIDAELEFEFPERDDLAETVDYAEVIEKIHELNATRSFQLLEVFAQATAELILQDFQRIQCVRLRLSKLRPTLAVGMQVDSIVAEVILSRNV